MSHRIRGCARRFAVAQTADGRPAAAKKAAPVNLTLRHRAARAIGRSAAGTPGRRFDRCGSTPSYYLPKSHHRRFFIYHMSMK